jgi:hypothetical protein
MIGQATTISNGLRMNVPSPMCEVAPQPQRPQIHQELEEMGYAIESLEKALSCLHDRLSMVTRPATPSPTGTEPKEIQKVPLSNVISEHRKKIRLLQWYASDLTDRLEI